ncbi:MAG: ADP-ribosylglycohydrolase family protein [Sphaerochaetaceae bacterium]|jgi:ADP-ribosylglycohydrolase|nr:ADP-ribosylglycohydrolase family protein [Sphaerochaetaceae bacterium]MDD3162799.1 ADP-ribosylglycohydrolase family protein [Sphaerochaetaceae bacterium]MDD4006876.1 ADP-ribosylglycohydrolase family protein [Sphaerochaetaceae bacterium]MDD4396008.1 ADP-ribosylglycohydrolase family protein [Sphaerochaetaceae bacterium]
MTLSQALSRFYLFYAAGDAVGKATEFMTLDAIRNDIGHINGLVDSSKSQNHSDLPSWAITDDTEQNLYLIRRYLSDGNVTIDNTVDALVRWIDETDAVSKHYIGPSSLKALQRIKSGSDPLKAGLGGVTCGGIMRVPSAVFASLILGLDLDSCIFNAIAPTHNTSVGMEAAYGYAYALRATVQKKDWITAAIQGCQIGLSKAPYISASATLLGRIDYLRGLDLPSWDSEKLKSFLYSVMGTGLPSYETAGAVFALAMHTASPSKAIFIASETGGDTDTIAALSGGLLSMMNEDELLSLSIREPLEGHNDLAVKI